MRIVVAIATCMLCGSAALAQDVTGPYVGFGIGQFDYQEDVFEYQFDDTTSQYKVYGGYRLNDTLAFEASFGETGDLEWSESGDLFPSGSYNVSLSSDFEFFEVRVLAHVGKFLAGYGYWDADFTGRIRGTSSLTGDFDISGSESDSGSALILGGQWDLAKVGLRAEFEYYDTDASVDVYSIGVGVHFRFR